jgi:hypothetical protein
MKWKKKLDVPQSSSLGERFTSRASDSAATKTCLPSRGELPCGEREMGTMGGVSHCS